MKRPPGKIHEARRFLQAELEGGPLRAVELNRRAGEREISLRTLERARAASCEAFKRRGQWFVRLQPLRPRVCSCPAPIAVEDDDTQQIRCLYCGARVEVEGVAA